MTSAEKQVPAQGRGDLRGQLPGPRPAHGQRLPRRQPVAELLGVADTEAVKKLATDLGASGDGRAQVITLALVVAALDARTPKDAWRGSPAGWQHYVTSGEYLKFLAAQGSTRGSD